MCGGGAGWEEVRRVGWLIRDLKGKGGLMSPGWHLGNKDWLGLLERKLLQHGIFVGEMDSRLRQVCFM